MKVSITILTALATAPSALGLAINNGTTTESSLFARGNPDYTCKVHDTYQKAYQVKGTMMLKFTETPVPDQCKGIDEATCLDLVSCDTTRPNEKAGVKGVTVYNKDWKDCKAIKVSVLMIRPRRLPGLRLE